MVFASGLLGYFVLALIIVYMIQHHKDEDDDDEDNDDEDAVPLKSVGEHNEGRRSWRREAAEALSRTGVACPSCGNELRWREGPVSRPLGGALSTMYPADCPACGASEALER